MHAYAHQWSCQLVYNPRLREGVGLTDGEGVERLWSRLRKLIGITRTSGVGDLSKRYLSLTAGSNFTEISPDMARRPPAQ